MLKYLSLLLFAPLFASSGCFTGMDATIGVGYSTAKGILTLDDPAISYHLESDYGDGSVAVLGKISYGWEFCDCYFFGLGGYAQYNNLEIEHNSTNASFTSNHKNTVPVDLGIEGRFGLAYADDQMIYVGIGPDWIYSKEKVTSSRHGTQNTDKWVLGPRLTGGAEQRVCGRLVLKEELSYAWYEEQKQTLQFQGTSMSVKLKPRLASFIFSAGYLF